MPFLFSCKRVAFDDVDAFGVSIGVDYKAPETQLSSMASTSTNTQKFWNHYRGGSDLQYEFQIEILWIDFTEIYTFSANVR